MMNSQASITCDDKDGFINLIDLRLSQRNRGRFSERARNGWWSLCKKTKNFYQEAKTHNRVEDIVTLDDGRKRITQYDKKGNVVRHSEGISLSFDYNPFPLFSLSPGDQITWDKQNRIEQIVSSKGSRLCPVVKGKSTRQFLYLDEDIQVLCNDVFQNILKNRLILLPNMEITVKVPVSGKANAFREEFPFDKKGYMVYVSFKNRRLSYISVIDGGTGEDGPLRAVSLEKDFNTGTFYKADVMGYQSLEYVLWDADFGSKLQNKPILPNHRAILLEMKDAYDQVATYMSAFDKYFYQPALDTTSSQNIQQQVKKNLRR